MTILEALCVTPGFEALLSRVRWMHKPPTTISNLMQLFQQVFCLQFGAAGTTASLSAWSRTGSTLIPHKQPAVYQNTPRPSPPSKKLLNKKKCNGNRQTWSSEVDAARTEQGPGISRIIEDSKNVIGNRKIMCPARSLSGKTQTDHTQTTLNNVFLIFPQRQILLRLTFCAIAWGRPRACAFACERERERLYGVDRHSVFPLIS